MGDVALTSIKNEDLLYKLFGINAELLIDHAWGWEPCTIADIKAYRPMSKSLNSGQVLHCPYTADGGRLIVREMCDLLVLDMVDKGVATNQLTLTVGYDADSLKNQGKPYLGEVTVDYYGRAIPKHAHGSVNFPMHTSSTKEIMYATLKLYDRIIDKNLLIRRVNLSVNNLINEADRGKGTVCEQMDFFTDYDKKDKENSAKSARYAREKSRQNAVISIRKKFGGNAILRGMNLEEGATTIDRNKQIGGHKA
jgi:DNA polymerase V